MKTRRVKILNTFYDKKRDLVQWQVQDVKTGDERVMCWPGRDLGPAVGVNSVIPPKLISKFCKDVEGKTINISSTADVTQEEATKFSGIKNEDDIMEMSEQSLRDAHKVFDKYPYWEILDTLKEHGQFKDSLDDESVSKKGTLSEFINVEDEEQKDQRN